MIDMQMMFIQYRISMVFLLSFQLLFLPLRYRKRCSLVIAILCYGMTGVLELIIFLTNPEMTLFLIVTILEIIIVQSTAYILCRYRDARALFTGILSSTYVLPGNVLFMGLSASLGPLSILYVLPALVHLILLLILVRVLRESFLSEMENGSKFWRGLCLVPALFYTVIYALICWPSSIYENEKNWVGVLFILILMGVAYALIIKMFSQQHTESELEKNKEFLETYALGLRREMDILRSTEEKMRVLKHDSRHVYQIIRNCLEEGRLEEIKAILDQMDIKLQSISTKRFCENITINGILNGCEAKAAKENVMFICQADVPEKLKINEFELATVISNLLENAIAGATLGDNRQPTVVIRIFPVKTQLVLEITNTFSGTCEFSKVTGLPLSTKGDGHGYGLRSVKAYANKHHAVFQYSVENGLFCIRLLTDM